MNNANTPIRPTERLQLLDVIRGFALFGIMFVNMTWFTGFAVLSPEQRENLGTERVDEVINWMIEIFVAGKFWTIFAFLFGVGVALQFSRQRDNDQKNFMGHYVRRLSVLLLLGLAHAVFLWFGDIVSLYAASGFVLLIFVSRSKKTALIWGAILLVAPMLQMAIWLLIHNLTADANAQDPGHGPAELLQFFATGSYSEAFAANWAFLKERWVIAVYDGRFFKLAGLFLIGWWSGQQNIFSNPSQHRRLLWGVVLVAVLIGIPANVLAFTGFPGVSLRPPSFSGWLVESLKSIGIPALGLGYVAALTLFFSSFPDTWLARMLAVAGRLSLSNYVGQSVIGIVVFYGCGFQQWGRFGVTWSIVFIMSIFAGQIIFSWGWLRFFQYGPLEWVWRCLTYGRVVRLRNERVASVQLVAKKT